MAGKRFEDNMALALALDMMLQRALQNQMRLNHRELVVIVALKETSCWKVMQGPRCFGSLLG